MKTITITAVTLVAVLHGYFLVLEMFLWQTPFGMKTFGTTPEVAASSAVLAANQGLYNGFLAAGLLWALASYGVIGAADSDVLSAVRVGRRHLRRSDGQPAYSFRASGARIGRARVGVGVARVRERPLVVIRVPAIAPGAQCGGGIKAARRLGNVSRRNSARGRCW